MANIDQWNVEIQRQTFRGSLLINIYIFYPHPNGKIDVVEGSGGIIKTIDRGEVMPPALAVDDDVLKALADALTKAGIKPREASFTEGKLEATVQHLEDMRSLVFLKKPLNQK